MIKFILISVCVVLSIAILLSCSEEGAISKETNNQHDMNCVDVRDNSTMERCENEEVVCYARYSYGLSCKFKEVGK